MGGFFKGNEGGRSAGDWWKPLGLIGVKRKIGNAARAEKQEKNARFYFFEVLTK